MGLSHSRATWNAFASNDELLLYFHTANSSYGALKTVHTLKGSVICKYSAKEKKVSLGRARISSEAGTAANWLAINQPIKILKC